MNYDFNKMDYSMSRPVDCSKDVIEDQPMYYGKNDDNTPHPKTDSAPHHQNIKPSDLKNCDLISLLLAATPPYLYNIPLVPQTFFFSEMLKSFVQAKTERQTLKSQQVHHRRNRKRVWREFATPKSNTNFDLPDKPLELTTPRHHEEEKPQPEKPKVEPEKKQSINFTAEKLANSSIKEISNPEPTVDPETITPPLWYPPVYPTTQPPYGFDPLHFFIDLRVSAHIWDRKIAAEKEELPAIAPLNLAEKSMPILEPSLNKNRHNSAFSVPVPRTENDEMVKPEKGSTNMHYILQNLKEIYNKKEKEVEQEKETKEDQKEDKNEEEDEDDDEETKKKKKKVKDLRALIGLELVVDYVKQDSDVSEDEDEPMVAVDEEKEVTG